MVEAVVTPSEQEPQPVANSEMTIKRDSIFFSLSPYNVISKWTFYAKKNYL